MKKALLVGIVLSLICAIVGCGQKEKAQYTLTFYSEGEVVHTLTAEEGLTIALREEADDPVKAEDGENTYTFAGWTLGEEGELTESYTVTGDASFYATFTATPIVYYSVTFADEWEGTRTVLSEQQVRAGNCAEIPAQSPEHEGYTFTGWSPDPSAAVTQDTEYVAQYDVNTYKLTLSTPLGETEAQYDFGAELLLEEPELPDFLSFADWYADEDFTQPFALEKMPARDVQVYAKCEFDFGAAKLSVGENLVYGGNNTASVEGLPADEKIVYTYLWKDGENTETAESYSLLHAGRHELSVTVKATFNEVEGEKTFTSTVDVAKKALTGTIEGVEASVVYGTRVAPALKVEGAVGGDEIPAAKIEIKGDKEGDPLPVGSYTVTASLPDLNDYSFETVTKQFEVVKKELTATLSAEQTTIVYGNTFAPTLTFAGFIEGENDSVVTKNGDVFRYEKDGANYTEKRFEVGSYTLSVAEGTLTADNYSFAAISSCTLTVQKAALTVTVQTDKESYVYGETPQASVTHTEFAYSDETETAVFGSELTPSLPAHEGKYYNVGHYTVTAGTLQAKNYELTVNNASFDITKKAVTVALGEATAVYGDAFAISAPTVSGLLEDEQDKEAGIVAALRYSCEGKELTLQSGKYSADVLFTVGAHTLTANAEGLTLDNYSLSTTDGTLTVTARPFTVSSQSKQVRDEKYEFTPKFEGAEAQLFSASGKLVLKTQDAGSYICSGSALSDSFLWEVPLKIVHSGEEVTENFSISYDLNVTLDNSTFTVSIPGGREFVYDGQEHTFPVTANPIESEQGTVVPIFEYTVNKEKIEGVPTFKDAGEYEVSCTITAANYNSAESSFTVNIAKAQYAVKAENKQYTYTPGCSFGENVEVTALPGNEYTVTYSYLDSETQEAPKFTKAVENAVVSFTVSGGENYEEYKGSYTVNVAKAQGTIDVSGVEKNYTYTGVLQTIDKGATTNNEEDGELTYSDNTFTTVAEGEALTVKVTLSEGANYTGAETTFKINVAKAQGTIDVGGVNKNYTYTGELQTIDKGATTNNKEDGKLTYSDNTFTTVAEGKALTVKVTLSEGANYTGAEVTFSITVDKAQGTINVDGVKKDYTYTGALQTINEGATTNNDEDGELSYSNNTFTTVEQGNALTVKVTLSEGENYTSAEATFKIHVAKAQGTIDVNGVEKHYTYTGELQTIDKGATTNNNDGDGVLTYSNNTFTTVTEGNALTVKVTLSDGENYTGAEETFSITVDKAQYTVKAGDKEYTYEPGCSFGENVEVTAVQGNEYTVTYSYLGNETQEAPKFTKAVGNAVVSFTVSGGENYEEYKGSYTVNVAKAQGTIDVSGVEKNYTYTGVLQTIDKGATTNNEEDGKLTYSDNTFTTVTQGNALNVKVTLQEGENYTGAETTFKIHVAKKTLERLPENVVAPVVSEQVNMVGKTLSDVSLTDNFTWRKPGQELEIGPHAYEACYNADPENIEPFVIQITFSTRKQVITLKVEEVEADYVANATADSVDIVKFSYTDESEADCAETIGEYIKCVFIPDAKTILAIGGTYNVQWTLTVTENKYFELQYGNAKETSYHGEDVFKWKSVELDGTLYTIEDALKLLESGKTATVKFNTSFASKEVSERLYADDSYRTVKEGATLLVPYGAADTGVVEQKQASTGHAATSPSGYVTLTLPAGELVVNGTLIVNAFRVSNSNQSGNVKGNQYGSLELAQGTKVTVKNKATFESMGFTYGEGEVFVENGATVYEPFSVPGWKGGTISAGIRNTVFPLNQFTASSLIAKTHILAGAVYSLRVALTASSLPQNGILTFVGTGNALMILTEGQVTKYVTENDGKVHFEIAGTVNFGTMSIAVSSNEASTSGLQVPIPGHFAFDFLSGSATLPDKVALKLLPGASLTVEREATFTIAKGGALYAYGDGNYTLGNSLSQWQDGKANDTLCAYPNTYVKGCYRKTPTLGYDAKTPATVTVKGTLVVEDSGHFGAKPSGEEGAELRLSAAAVLTNSIKEDYSKTEDIGGFFGALMGNKGAFFTTTFNCGDLTAGNYTYTGGTWKKGE